MTDLRECLPHSVTSIAVETILFSDGEGLGMLVLTTDQKTFKFAMPDQGADFMIKAMNKLLVVLKRHARSYEREIEGDWRNTKSRVH